ncbi:MAG: hypothetical protein IJP31_12760 [Lachnospiraceae bacterium]|nr:hypothetical protein [Lachnospiraceae bacterium]
MKKGTKRFRAFLLLILVLAGIKVISLGRYEEREAGVHTTNKCRVYYLLNLDGMKGLGHVAFMLTDEAEKGILYSYNGMQYSLAECLLGKAGVGKMKEFSLSQKEVEEFLLTGDLQVSDAAECDNFDRLMYRYISREEYEMIREQAKAYIAAGETFEKLYAASGSPEGEKELVDFVSREDVPKYQIYRHNCDTAARIFIEKIDEEMAEYNANNQRLVPAKNYKGMWKQFGDDWGFLRLGEDSPVEWFLWYIL